MQEFKKRRDSAVESIVLKVNNKIIDTTILSKRQLDYIIQIFVNKLIIKVFL